MPEQFNELLNKKILTESNFKKLNETFRRAKPFPHILIKNFLDEKIAEKLLKEIKKENFIEKEADLFKFKQTHDLHFTKNKFIKEFHSAFLNWNFFNFVSAITNKKFKGTLDMSASLYESTSYLLPHDDELEGRKIAYILYLSKDFKEKDGGAFALYNTKKILEATQSRLLPRASVASNLKNFEREARAISARKQSFSYQPTTISKKYLPRWNSLLLFEVSEISFHEVEENLSKKNRYAIGGWLH